VCSSDLMPGQLPTLAWEPVSRLNRVDLPVLGMPTRAIFFMPLYSGLQWADHDGAGVGVPEHELGHAQGKVHGTAQSGLSQDAHGVARVNSQGAQASRKLGIEIQALDARRLSCLQVGEGSELVGHAPF